MKCVRVTLACLVQVIALVCLGTEQSKLSQQYNFKCERYDAQGGSLFKSYGGNFDHNNSVRRIFVDSKGRVWVGTVTGLAVYDGKKWTSRTFDGSCNAGLAGRAILGLFRLSDCAPDVITEGPPGTIWLGGDFGIWRYKDDRYQEISSHDFGYIPAMAVDRQGALWVVTKYNVQRYDGKGWSTVLCPYFDKSIHYELTGLRGIAIGTNGNVWIGATLYVEPQGPWSNEGTIWVVDQAKKSRERGPPTAALFEFDGKRWRAFGPQHGLRVEKYGEAMPEVDEVGRIRVRTSNVYYTLKGDTWKPVKKPEKRWVLRKRQKGLAREGTELLFRDGESLVEVRATDHKTGELLDLSSDQRVFLNLVEDQVRDCIWLGTWHGLYRIWLDEEPQ